MLKLNLRWYARGKEFKATKHSVSFWLTDFVEGPDPVDKVKRLIVLKLISLRECDVTNNE